MATLEELRDETRRIDQQLLELITRRTALGEEMAELKRQRGAELYDEAHIREVLKTAKEWAKRSGLDAKALQEVFNLLIEMRMERELRKASK